MREGSALGMGANPALELFDESERRVPTDRERFLARLAGKGSRRYMRYSGMPLRYAGGKSLAVGPILEFLPDDVGLVVSPFFGGGSIEIACARELGIKVLGFDVFGILTNYWDAQIRKPKKLADLIGKWDPIPETYAKVKQRLKGHWTGEDKIIDKMELAAHYWFNHNLSYGPGFLGWMSKIYEEEPRYRRLLDKVRNFDCSSRLRVRQASFEKVLRRYDSEFLYCDPPYYLGEDSRMFRGIYPQRNFPVHHNNFAHERLRDMLLNRSGGFILSYNDCPTIRKWYRGLKIVEVKWQYTLGQGETRIGKNRIEQNVNHVKQSHEILIIK